MSLDRTILQQIREVGGQALVRELFQTFLEHAPGRLDQLRKSLESGDLDTAERTAHSFRSSAASIGAAELAAAAGRLESEILAGRPGLFEERYPAFEQRLAALVGLLRLELDRGEASPGERAS